MRLSVVTYHQRHRLRRMQREGLILRLRNCNEGLHFAFLFAGVSRWKNYGENTSVPGFGPTEKLPLLTYGMLVLPGYGGTLCHDSDRAWAAATRNGVTLSP